MSSAVTLLSKMSDTTYDDLRVTASRGRQIGGPGVISYEVSVKVGDIRPTKALCKALLFLRTARARQGVSARTIGILAGELLEESDRGAGSTLMATRRSENHMDRFVSCSHSEAYHPAWRHALWLSTVLLCCSLTAPGQRRDTSISFSTRATHLLGFANARNNSTGILSVQDDSLQFQPNGKPGAKVKIALVRDVFLGEESKQIGGLPMTLGKTAAPFGGGRVVSLFAHKKYDTLTLEYVDSDEGIHGAIFQLEKGQGEVVKNELIVQGVTISSRPDRSTKEGTAESMHENK
jgi:hypothetical protein